MTVQREYAVVAVVVTWNRKELLREALHALSRQTHPLASVVVVDNASTDGSAAAVRGWQADLMPLELVELRENVGGAGGFAVGIERAVDRSPDYVWLLDDDTVPTETALAELLAAADRSPVRPTVLASRVVWTDGRDHPMNTPRPKAYARSGERRAARQAGGVPIRSASFVSILCAADAVRERGLPIADYFLWNDDFEYTTRLLRGKFGLYCPGSVVLHKTKAFGSTDADPGDRFYYEVRNKVWLFTRSRGLAAPERVVYLGATLRRWARTFRRSEHRRTLWQALCRGLRDGFRARPRPNEDVLSDARR